MNGTTDSIEALCRQAQAGNFHAASELVAATYQPIYAYLRRLCGHDETAADLTQQTFTSVWRSLQNFDGRARFMTWLHRIAHNVYVDWRRKGNRLDAQSDDWWDACASDESDPFDNTADRDAAHLLYKTVEELVEEQRVTVHLHYYQGLTLQETADALNIATSTVKYRLRNALDFLKARMADPNFECEENSMNDQTIEKLLRNAPRVKTPSGLLKQLQADIELPATTASGDQSRITNRSGLRRWLPAFGFALWFLGCIVVFGIQASRIAELKRAHEAREKSLAGIQHSQVVQDRALSLTKELEQLRKDAADTQRLRAEADGLRAQVQKLTSLREQNQQLRAELKSQTAPPPKPEEDFMLATANRMARTKCINNLKQVCLAALIWANKNKSDSFPATIPEFKPFLDPDAGGEKLLRCPADDTRFYDFLSLGRPLRDPNVVFARCLLHNNVAAADGSAHQLSKDFQVVQNDGKWIFTRIAE